MKLISEYVSNNLNVMTEAKKNGDKKKPNNTAKIVDNKDTNVGIK